MSKRTEETVKPEYIREFTASGHEIKVHSFTVFTVARFKENNNTRLRFSVSWRVEMAGDPWAWQLDGWTARLDRYGHVICKPPQIRQGYKFFNILWISPAMYRGIVEAVSHCPLIARLTPDTPDNNVRDARDREIQAAKDIGFLEAGGVVEPPIGVEVFGEDRSL